MARPRRTAMLLSGLALLGLAGVGVAATGGTSSAEPKTSSERSLSEAMNVPHGKAAGDEVLQLTKREEHAKVRDEAKGVDDGSKKQASGVQLHGPDKVTSDDLLSASSKTAGCTPGYGEGRACLPTTPPSAGAMGMTVEQMPWTCTEVRTLLPAGIALNAPGKDPLHLDSNGDGTACGKGDA